MSERDKRIGRAVSAIRGDRSQAAIATAMRERGWKWSQATVWSVEKGERPLRLAEASDLASVLGERLDRFLVPPAEALVEQQLHKVTRQADDLRRAMFVLQDYRFDLARMVTDGYTHWAHTNDVEDLDPALVKRCREELATTTVEAVFERTVPELQPFPQEWDV